MSKPNQNQNSDIKNPNKGNPGQNKPQPPKQDQGNRGNQMNPMKEEAGKKK
jgi:hypothetical protein